MTDGAGAKLLDVINPNELSYGAALREVARCGSRTAARYRSRDGYNRRESRKWTEVRFS
jgi:hypothetical protein